MTRPSIVPGSLASNSLNGSSPLVVPAPAVFGLGHYFIAGVDNQDQAQASDYTSAGWTRIGIPFVSNVETRVTGWYMWGPVTDVGATPATFNFVRPGAGTRQVVITFAIQDWDGTVDSWSPTQSTVENPGVIDGTTVGRNESLKLALAGGIFVSPNSSANPAISDGSSLVGYRQEPITGLSSVSRNVLAVWEDAVEAGSIANANVVWDGTATQVTGHVVVLSNDTPVVTTTISSWRTDSTFGACAHRGCPDNLTRTEMTFDTYEHAVNVLGFTALEASCWRSSDGVWVLQHDQTTGRMNTTDLDIPTTDWATLSAVVSKVGAKPIMRLDDFLDSYSHLVLFIENKSYANFVEFFDILDAADPGKTQIVFKASGDTGSAFEMAKNTYGFTTWGYYFGDTGPSGAQNMPTELVPECDWVGLSSGPSNDSTADEWWEYAYNNGRDIMGHIVRSQDDWDSMRLQGAQMGMVNISGVIPLNGTPVVPGGGGVVGTYDDDLYWFFDLI